MQSHPHLPAKHMFRVSKRNSNHHRSPYTRPISTLATLSLVDPRFIGPTLLPRHLTCFKNHYQLKQRDGAQSRERFQLIATRKDPQRPKMTLLVPEVVVIPTPCIPRTKNQEPNRLSVRVCSTNMTNTGGRISCYQYLECKFSRLHKL